MSGEGFPPTGTPRIGILGPGAVGRVLAVNLASAGYRVGLVVGRRLDAANSLAGLLPGATASDRLADLPGVVDWLLCTVSDDALEEVTERLAQRDGDAWRGRVIMHTSGVRSSRVLEPLAHLGAEVASLHPGQTFPLAGPVPSLDGITFGLEGTPGAIAAARSLVSRLGGEVLELNPDIKPLYHLAAVTASNYLVTLLACVEETLHAAGLDVSAGRGFLAPLIESTWRNVQRNGTETALTGPVARGDRKTLRFHMAAIGDYVPQLAPFYAAAMMETVRLAVRGGRLPPSEAEGLLDDLQLWIKEGATE